MIYRKKITSASFGLVLLLLATACKQPGTTPTLFNLVPSSYSGVTFTNLITENDAFNVLKNYYLYNGGGVGIGDFDRNGLPDLYFTGNMVSSRLYLNQGNLKFQDVTKVAGVSTDFWATGVSVADVNADGWLDIYVGAGIFCQDGCPNRLYINQGLNQNGIPIFEEMAAKFGLEDRGHTTHAAFLDYDRDQDLDLFTISNTVTPLNKNLLLKKDSRLIQGKTTDHLYRNEGLDDNGQVHFKEVSSESGIDRDGYSLGVAVNDINNDGWPDVYVANDFLPDDLLYLNQKDGTFREAASEYLKHQSANGMGVDLADINNDGLPEIVVLDMLPEDNEHQKRMLTPMNYDVFQRSLQLGYAPQFMRNTLQLNNGSSNGEHIPFSEIGQLAGIFNTDWSWGPLLADFDLDGYKDLFITNGFVKDMTDLDFINYRKPEVLSGLTKDRQAKLQQLYQELEGDYLPNYVFKNNGDLTFSNQIIAWGFYQPSYSNGGAYADLDNDGDLDLVVSNINAEAYIYENNAMSSLGANYLMVELKGPTGNPDGIGAKVQLKYGDDQFQSRFQSPHRGYLSTSTVLLHFGLGPFGLVDSVRVIWPDGKTSTVTSVSSNQTLVVKYHKSSNPQNGRVETLDGANVVFNQSNRTVNLHFLHQENEFTDFKEQPLLLEMCSRSGPALAVGKMDGNAGLDVFVGGAAGAGGALFYQQPDGRFKRSDFLQDAQHEDVDALLFDADGDGDNDLYVVSGGSAFPEGSPNYQDRLYLNDGQGNFQKAVEAVPVISTSGSCVAAGDFDSDGDPDLFIGGRVIPGKYPLPPKSCLLINEEGKFVDKTTDLARGLEHLGMVTDALWTDFDNDRKMDLVVAGEWMPLQFFQNVDDRLEPLENIGDLPHGFWNCLASADYDKDGDVDLAVGNLGMNTYLKASPEEPVNLYAEDFDGNGSIDPVLTLFMPNRHGERKEYTWHSRDAIVGQLPEIRRKLPAYRDFGLASIWDILEKKTLKSALKLAVETTKTIILENLGDGNFEQRPLPIEAQISKVTSMVFADFNGDSHHDLLLAGNSYATESVQGWYDAALGLLLYGDGKGNFLPVPARSSGLILDKSVSKIALLRQKERTLLLAAANNDSLVVYLGPPTAE